MRKTKRVFPMYAIYDRTSIQKMLEKQALKGWMPEKLGNYLWKFKRTEPRELHFAVTYFPEATFFDPEPSEAQRTLQEFCQHAGWELVGAYGPMQVFSNEADEPLPIETDPIVELDSIHKSVKKSYLSSYWILLFVWLINLAMRVMDVFKNPLSFFGSNLNLFNLSNCLALVIMCSVEIFGYYHWHRKAERVARDSGAFVQTRNFKWIELILLGFIILELGYLLATLDPEFSQMMAMMLAGFVGVIVIGQYLISLLKRYQLSAQSNKLISMGVVFVLTTVVIIFCIYSVFTRVSEPEAGVETYEYQGVTFEVHYDTLPLTVEDLLETDYNRYTYELETERSLFMTTREAVQNNRIGESAPGIHYDIYDIYIPAIFDVCFEDILHSYDKFNDFDDAGNTTNDYFQPVDAGPWGADAAYCRYSGGLPTHKFLLRYGYRIVEITFDWAPDTAQMAVVGEKLGK